MTQFDQNTRYSSQQGLKAVQALDVFGTEVLFFLCTLLRVSKQGINSSIYISLIIVNLKLVVKEFLGTANMSGAQTLRVHESREVVVVGKYKDFMLRALQVISLNFVTLNND